MPRRSFLASLTALFSPMLGASAAEAASAAADPQWNLSDAEWKRRLSPAAYQVLRKEGTERPFSSPLNNEKRAGTFHCAGCDLPLFSSKAKYESGTGWPSFWQPLPQAIGGTSLMTAPNPPASATATTASRSPSNQPARADAHIVNSVL
jgi:peptide-methionine (R)-S-oxide reductase